jgi:hypothetical protein
MGGMQARAQPNRMGGAAPGGQNPLALLEQTMPPDQWAQFKARMQAMSPDEQQAAINALAKDYGLAGSNASADMSRADALRMGAPQGRQAGGMYVAANPLEHVGQMVHNKMRNDEYMKAKGERGAAAAGAEDVRARTMAELLRMR